MPRSVRKHPDCRRQTRKHASSGERAWWSRASNPAAACRQPRPHNRPVERSSSDELRDLARLRLAAVLLDDKAYDEALALLEAKHAAPMAAQYAALKGDVLVAKNNPADAKAAYRLALEKADARSGAFRASVQLRLDALGG